MPEPTALITGASSGIGMYIAHEFARHGHPVILVARDQADLEEVAKELRERHSATVDIIAQDLTAPGGIEKIADQMAGRQIDILVNNAGIGQKGAAWEIPFEDDLAMVQTNILAAVQLIKMFVPGMVKRGSGRVLNTASVAGFEPGPGYATYSSTKAFVLSYSEALATELKDTGVTVTALCPGPTDTDFFVKADMLETRAFQQANLGAPQNVAEDAYKAVMAGDRVIVSGPANKAMVFMRRMIPESLQAKINQLLTDDVPEDKQKRERGDIEAKEA